MQEMLGVQPAKDVPESSGMGILPFLHDADRFTLQKKPVDLPSRLGLRAFRTD